MTGGMSVMAWADDASCGVERGGADGVEGEGRHIGTIPMLCCKRALAVWSSARAICSRIKDSSRINSSLMRYVSGFFPDATSALRSLHLLARNHDLCHHSTGNDFGLAFVSGEVDFAFAFCFANLRKSHQVPT